jgi:hypothetical protein
MKFTSAPFAQKALIEHTVGKRCLVSETTRFNNGVMYTKSVARISYSFVPVKCKPKSTWNSHRILLDLSDTVPQLNVNEINLGVIKISNLDLKYFP